MGLGKKKVTGEGLIAEGMTLLTKATDAIEQGAGLNAQEIETNKSVIVDLEARNADLEAKNAKAMQVVANFKKNILGEG